MVLPNFTKATAGPTLSVFQMVFLSLMSVVIYSIFLYVQNRRHRGFFVLDETAEPLTSAPMPATVPTAPLPPAAVHTADHHHTSPHSTLFHSVMLACYGLPLVMLAKQMSAPLDAVVGKLGAPAALGGFVMAFLVLTPESIAAIRAARDNKLQRSVNILLGSVLASIGLTIPLVIAVSLITGRVLALGLGPAEIVLLVLTLVTSILTFSLPRTNVLLGCVHLLLFGAYLMMMFDR